MNRRTLLFGLAATLAAPLAADAQQRPVPRIGILAGAPSSYVLQVLVQFRQELGKLGWIDGRTVTVLEPRWVEGRNERFPALAVEILKADPRVIVVFSAPATRALQQATAAIPIVMLKEAVPAVTSLALFQNPSNPGTVPYSRRVQAVAEDIEKTRKGSAPYRATPAPKRTSSGAIVYNKVV